MWHQHAEAIRQVVSRDGIGSVLEYGAGGSSIWLTQVCHPDTMIYTVEHDTTWARKVAETIMALSECGIRTANHHTMVFALPLVGYANPEALGDLKFDVIIIDGIGRHDCLRMTKHLLSPGGHVFLHDAQRDEYAVEMVAVANKAAKWTCTLDPIQVGLFHAEML